MGMAVDEAGNGHHAGTIDHRLGRLLGGCAVNGGDFSILDADVGPENHLHFGIHGHRGDVCNQCIHKNVSFPL